ncbi:NAD(P)/FAD-dependent oxidoreductase [Streptomyces sp. TP-A0874]|uniref:NAD(P)/FAD-dependent oxidoreductase n=1 Tax=Streptomyces sp. TP-A0874 TaxID=549819 RepID=UPI000D1AD3A2|nr:FAD-dependent oxidoreductase [Streptomyces sp. TP-A0874]
MAGAHTAVALREEGWPGAITLVGAEPHPPYDRPPLSKAVLLGAAEGSAFDIDFTALDVELLLGRRAHRLHPDERRLDTEAGPIAYDHLVIATGAEPRRLSGSHAAPRIHVLRTLDDAERLRSVLAARRRIVVVGAGWIGAEFATAAREAGCEVTVVEAADQPLAGALPAEITRHMADWYAESGARLLTGAQVSAVADGTVLLADGRRLTADEVVVGIGARPVTDWLAGSGVDLCPDGSVRADERLRTSVPEIYAVGDCASFPSARYGERLLIHHWDNALQGPRTVAAQIVSGPAGAAVHDPVPYFWSEQFGRFVQYAGHHTGADEMLWRGNPTDTAWSVCWLRAEKLVAVLAVGRPRDLAQGRKLIERGAVLDRGPAADTSVPLKTAVAERRGG